MHKLLVINSKGGSGKTTLATNLACELARAGHVTALYDDDPQASSTAWLQTRPESCPRIYGINPHVIKQNATRSWQQRIPPETAYYVVDSPAGIALPKLFDLMRSVDTVLVPVLPSTIDMHATDAFILNLMKACKIKATPVRIGLVVNRLRERTLALRKLENFLASVGIPIVGRLHDSQNYVRATDQGLGICELKKGFRQEYDAWAGILRWLLQGAAPALSAARSQPLPLPASPEVPRRPLPSPAPSPTLAPQVGGFQRLPPHY